MCNMKDIAHTELTPKPAVLLSAVHHFSIFQLNVLVTCYKRQHFFPHKQALVKPPYTTSHDQTVERNLTS